MGLRSGVIPTSAIAASSQKDPSETLDTVRLGNPTFWVAARDDVEPWIEILPSASSYLEQCGNQMLSAFLCPLGNPLTLSGFEIRGEPTEIYVQYDTLTTTNNAYADNVSCRTISPSL